MMTINGTPLAESNRESIESLFKAGQTAHLQARRHKRRIMLTRPDGEPFGVVANGFIASASRLPDGSIWYSYGWPSELGAEPSYGEHRAIAAALEVTRDQKGPCYK